MERTLLDHACPKCGAPTVERYNQRNGTTFLGCANYPDCDGILNTYRGKPVDPNQTCPNCGEQMRTIIGQFGAFFGCPNYKEKGCGTLKLKDAKKWTEKADHSKLITKADRRKQRAKKTKADLGAIVEQAKAGELKIFKYPSRVKSKHGVTSLRRTEEGEIWVSGLRRDQFDALGIEVIETGNRYGGWYYLVRESDLERYPFEVQVI